MVTLIEALAEMKRRHIEYIESTYHVRNPHIIQERRRILDETGGVVGEPWLEATPGYAAGRTLSEMKVPDPVKRLLEKLRDTDLRLVYDPLYRHQVAALEGFFGGEGDPKDLVVSTGTGSGKTEIFLYSILGCLALEGKRGITPNVRGVRAIILYPMNALVSDQVSRLRRSVGDPSSSSILRDHFGRTVQFGMYTSRTPYHGVYDEDKNSRLVRPLVKYFVEMERDPNRQALHSALLRRGRIPQKDLGGFLGERNTRRENKYHTQRGDRELLTRQEMHSPNEFGGTPDILVTNYSMLEYMLLRPIEQPIFEDTRGWLRQDPTNKLLLVIDEAHLYRGSQGAEVSLLIRRLTQHLGVGPDRVRCILTSASIVADERAIDQGREFASSLTGISQERFQIVLGKRKSLGGELPLPASFGNALVPISSNLERESLRSLSDYFGWSDLLPVEPTELRLKLGHLIGGTPEYKTFHDFLAQKPMRLSEAAGLLFPQLSQSTAEAATLNLALLATTCLSAEDVPLLSVRVHQMFRGLPRIFACVNSDCPGRKIEGTPPLTGALFTSPRMTCVHCGARVFELYTDRTCGAAYLRVFYSPQSRSPRFLWTQRYFTSLREVHLLIEEPRGDPDMGGKDPPEPPLNVRLRAAFLDAKTGYLLESPPADGSRPILRCWWPPSNGADAKKRARGRTSATPVGSEEPETWPRCYACGRVLRGQSRIMDLETSGEAPFANVIKTMFMVQPPSLEITPDEALRLPNKGRKVLCFSDGRQKAARLARDLQRSVEQDSFREIIALAAQKSAPDSPIESLFASVLAVTRTFQTSLFDDGDGVEAGGYAGSRSLFQEAQSDIDRLCNELSESESELLNDEFARAELNSKKPRQYNQQLLRTLGDRNYSIRQAMIGYAAPCAPVLRFIQEFNRPTDPELIRNVVLAVIDHALRERALDPDIREEDRVLSRRSGGAPLGYRRHEGKSEGEGLMLDDILPSGLRKAMGNIPEEATQRLLTSVRRGGPGHVPPLFLPKEGRFWLNPSAVSLLLRPADDWRRCMGCGRFSPFDFNGHCPEYDCQGAMIEVPEGDLYARTRKDFLRSPVLNVLGLKAPHRGPFTIRSEEHTAQLTSKDSNRVFGRAERYELLFQDILLDDLSHEQPVDVLSCTTTMEVGIDIGSLTGVALRTVPPRPDNYQQRAGRAGRRGAALSFISTFADNSPHESYIFENPSRIISTEPATPTIYVRNLKILERHLHAALIQAFFQRSVSLATEENNRRASVFESLGTANDFFHGSGPFSLQAFQAWTTEEMVENRHGLTDEIGAIVPAQIEAESGSGDGVNGRIALTKRIATEFSEALVAHRDRVDWSLNDEDENLLATLQDEGFLPTFGFPLDLCEFIVRDIDRSRGGGRGGAIVNRYEMSQGLTQALTEYAPGREVVVDKHTFTSYGLYFPFTRNPLNRGSAVDWDSLPWLNFCRFCGITLEEETENIQRRNGKCPINPEHEVESILRYRPEAFAPEVDQGRGAIEGEDRTGDRSVATLAEFPVPIEARPPKGTVLLTVSQVAVVRSLPSQQLVVRNFGPDQRGYSVCRSCGAIGTEDGLVSPHNRPYQVEIWHMKGGRTRQCVGGEIKVAFAHDFLTDLAILSVSARSPLNFSFNESWFKSAARSLSEALVLGATRALKIDTTELEGNYREVGRYPGEPNDVLGHIEFFLFDTTPGGAGFASQAASRFQDVIAETSRILTDCNCETSCHRCLRTYDNRFFHETMTRHGAMAILTFALSGTVPSLQDVRSHALTERLAEALAIFGFDCSRLSETAIRVSTTEASIEARVDSAFREGVHSLFEGAPLQARLGSQGASRTYSDFELEMQLPRIVEDIVEMLRTR